MKEELQGKLVEILTSIQTAAGRASDFAMAELPDIAQSYVAFGRVYETLMVSVCTLVMVGIAVATVKFFRLALRPEGVLDDMPAPFAFFFGGLAAVIPAILLAVHLQPFLLVWFAPKVWLLKEIAGMLK
jgi:hypothetical protein